MIGILSATVPSLWGGMAGRKARAAALALAAAALPLVGGALLPEGISPVEVEPLPFADGYDDEAAELYGSGVAAAVVGLRRAIHEKPGVMYEEYDAAEISYNTLRAIGIEDSNIKTGLGVTGLVAHIGAGTLESSMAGEVPTLLLRADMDALPIHEETDVPFRSTYDGVMHACGHDAHTAMLLGAAMLLKEHEEALAATGAAVRLFFQPAEECGAGAKAMIDEGAIEGTDDAIMLHVANNLDTGVIAVKVCRPAPLSPPRPPRRRRRLTCAPRPPPSPKPGLMLYVCPPRRRDGTAAASG